MLSGAPLSALPLPAPSTPTQPQVLCAAERPGTPSQTRHAEHSQPDIPGSTLPFASERFALWLQQHHQLQSFGTLAGDLTHDLNNTLNVIAGYAELMLEEFSLDTLAQQYLDQVIAASIRAKDLVSHLRKGSRQHERDLGPVALAPVITDVLAMLRASCPATLMLQQSVAPGVPPILADATQMSQVVLNLCLNAVRAMRQSGGRLEVRLDTVTLTNMTVARCGTLRPGSYVRLSIQDTGSGMPPDTLARIFEPFFTTNPPEEGTGIGLTAVESIVRHHAGALDVSSLPGHGSTFTLYFPAMAEAEGTPASPNSAVADLADA